MSFVVIATWVAQEGKDAAVADVIARMVDPSRAEPACLAYLPHRELDDRCVFVLYEVYVDRAGYDAHCASDHFQRLAVAQGLPLLQSRERVLLEPLDTSDRRA